jgi:chromosome partitioning protein
MSTGFFNLKKALQLFGSSTDELNSRGICERELPAFARSESDNRFLKSWSLAEMPSVGEKIGFMKKPARPIAVSVFVTKGGVLKSTLTLNLARMAALNGLRVCVLGLDMQGDITSALSGEDTVEENDSLEEALARIDSLRGLPDLFTGAATLAEVLRPTDIPTLFYVPETPELVALDQSLVNRNRREYWLSENVVTPLKESFDLIIMDCSPNWNRLITNALIASDALISPLECKINNFRNLKTFRALLAEFRTEMRAEFRQIFVPTRLATSRKLSREICEWYRANLTECSTGVIRESLQGEEAVAMRISIPEYAPTSDAAVEIRELIQEIWLELSATHIRHHGHDRVREHTL